MDDVNTCDGCGKLQEGRYELSIVRDLHDRVLGRFCRARGGGAKQSCVAKLVASRKPTCAGCGEAMSINTYRNGNAEAAARLRPFCDGCARLLRDAKKEPRKWYAIDAYGLFGQPLPSGCYGPYDALKHALGDILERTNETFIDEAEVLCTKDSRGLNTGDIWARLTKRQADGVVALQKAYAALVKHLDEWSREQGGALLVQLARGEVSIDDFNDARKPARSKK